AATGGATIGKASAMVSVVDNDNVVAVGLPSLYVRDVVVDEKAGTATFSVLLGGTKGQVANSTVTVDYAVTAGTGAAANDFAAGSEALNGTLIFGVGETVKSVTINLTDDGAPESIERINLALSDATNAVIADGNGAAVLGASDASNVGTPTLTVDSQVVSESDGYVDVVVRLNAPSAGAVAVNYSTANGAAVANYDYRAVSGTLNFAAGETTKIVRIELFESASLDTAGTTEAFSLNLTGPANAVIGNGSATITIIDDDAGINVQSFGISDDVYTLVFDTDLIVENAGGGTDTIVSAFDHTLQDNLENLTLTGSATTGTGNALDNVLAGNELANTLTGLGGNDSLDGGAGNDTLVGGAGNDVYAVDVAGDVITELAGAGTDTVRSAITYTLVGTQLEHLTLLGSAAIDATGNDGANILTGNTGANTLTGGLGADTMAGGAGNDVYNVTADDTVSEQAGQGTDTVRAGVAWTLGAEFENLVLLGGGDLNGTGNGLANRLTGNAGANTLDGLLGNDTLEGGAGDDLYIVNAVGDVVIEAADAGTDTVRSSATHTLSANVEDLQLTGAGAIGGTGNGLANHITGNGAANALDGGGGNDTLDGGAGADAMSGGAGNDLYLVDAAGDTAVEAAGQGTDTVNSQVSFVLGANVEHLQLLTASSINGTGNDLANRLTGNAGHNRLEGAAGADTLVGGGGRDTLDGGTGSDSMSAGAGDDLYVVDVAGDSITELAGEGVDTVESAITYSLAGTELEHLTLTGGGAVNATGNAGANRLTGNAGANILDGGLAADTMAGAAGNDLYFVDDLGDVLTELAAGGIDTVRSTLAWTLGAQLENLELLGSADLNATGNGLANRLTGNAGANTLNGADGVDTMLGGAGDDTYYANLSSDIVTELADQGLDLVISRASFTLTGNIENLTLSGTDAVDGTGNVLANRIAGNTAANVLNGGGGSDTLTGGAGNDTLVGVGGNDTYVVADAGDVVVETAEQGTDTVQSSVDYTLGNEVERLTLTGTGDIDGTGNGVANRLLGNAAANVLSGEGGDDELRGGSGNDSQFGGDGADLVAGLGGNDELFGGAGSDTVIGAAGNDVLEGGTDNDTLTGGLGSDGFRFASALDAVTNVDRVTDFNVVADRLELDDAVFTALGAPGALLASAFRAGTAATDADDRVIYDQATGRLFYDADGSGAGAQLLFAQLNAGVAVTVNDLFVV
ncbi:MAG TPA: Calx-beta domain-containing protein, partial [Methylibium sp.]|nr:Calx-beta domain-containing protein [Methylibium sp.]